MICAPALNNKIRNAAHSGVSEVLFFTPLGFSYGAIISGASKNGFIKGVPNLSDLVEW